MGTPVRRSWHNGMLMITLIVNDVIVINLLPCYNLDPSLRASAQTRAIKILSLQLTLKFVVLFSLFCFPTKSLFVHETTSNT